jgi:DNA-binding MarR family transcriptional regulator
MLTEVAFYEEIRKQVFGLVFWQSALLWQKTIAKNLSEFNLTFTQFILLYGANWLKRNNNDISQILLAKLTKIDPMMTSKTLRKLETMKLIKRTTQPLDLRSKTFELTKKGKITLQKASNLLEKTDSDFFSIVGKNRELFYTVFQNFSSHYL